MNNKDKIKQLQKEVDRLNKEIDMLELEEKIKVLREHEYYEGKCYREGNKYYRVLSAYSTNNCRLTCLTFDLDSPIYDEWCRDRDIFHGIEIHRVDFYLELFEVEDVFVFGNSNLLDEVTEITLEEFNIAQQKIIDKFIKETNEIGDKIKEMIRKREKEIKNII